MQILPVCTYVSSCIAFNRKHTFHWMQAFVTLPDHPHFKKKVPSSEEHLLAPLHTAAIFMNKNGFVIHNRFSF